MKELVLIISLALALFFPCAEGAGASVGPVSDIQWVKTLGSGTARCIRQASDGGYLLTGWTKGQPGLGSDIFLIKTDELGNKIWETLLSGNGYSCGYGVSQTSDGGAVVVGDTKAKNGYDHDVFVAKVDAEGNQVWERNFGGPYCDYGASVVQTEDGGYLVAGGTESYGAGIYDVYLLRLNERGQKIWERTYGSKGSDCGYALLQTPDDKIVVAGNTDSTESGKTSVYLFQTDARGNLLWERKISRDDNDSYGWSLQPTHDGGYLVAGETAVVGASGGGLKSYLVKTDALGNRIWERIYDEESYGTAYAVLQTGKRHFILVGKREGVNGYNLYILKTDARGKIVGERLLKDMGGSCAYACQPTRDGGYIVAGERGSGDDGKKQILLLKLVPDRLGLQGRLIVLLALGALLLLLVYTVIKKFFRPKFKG